MSATTKLVCDRCFHHEDMPHPEKLPMNWRHVPPIEVDVGRGSLRSERSPFLGHAMDLCPSCWVLVEMAIGKALRKS